MCLLIYKPKGKTIPASHIRHAATVNPDGAGIAYFKRGRVHVEKSPRWSADHVNRAMERLNDVPAIIHFRMATHGSVNRANAHPFNLPHGHAAAHNGVINGMSCRQDESDTRAFLRDYVSPYLEKSGDIPASLVSLWEKEIGSFNKLAIMAPTGKVHLVNERSGEWLNGVWYSNTYSLPSTALPSRFTPKPAMAYSDAPDLFTWHARPECFYCLSPINSALGFGTLDNGELLCDSCADKF
jgi:hypothetical protein